MVIGNRALKAKHPKHIEHTMQYLFFNLFSCSKLLMFESSLKKTVEWDIFDIAVYLRISEKIIKLKIIKISE